MTTAVFGSIKIMKHAVTLALCVVLSAVSVGRADEKQKERDTLQGHRDRITCLALSADGKMLASASADNTVLLWDMSTKKSVRTLQANINPVTAVAFAPDGATLVSVSDD